MSTISAIVLGKGDLANCKMYDQYGKKWDEIDQRGDMAGRWYQFQCVQKRKKLTPSQKSGIARTSETTPAEEKLDIPYRPK